MTSGSLFRHNHARASLQDPLPLVGRKDELAALESRLEEGQDGPSVVFVRGEGGVGKSRLASELAERAARRNWVVVKGRAYPVESGIPYAILSDAWLPILRSLEASALTVLSRGGEAELRYLFPALGGGRDDLDDVASTDPHEFRTRLMWNFAEFVRRYAARAPVLCILEDLQWADDSSLQLVHFLARQTRGHPILILCTYNDQERDRSTRLVQIERSLESIGAADVIRLEPLSRDHVTELVCRSFGVDTDLVLDFSSVLYGWTRGNAFFVEEIVKWLVSSGRLRSEGGSWVGWDETAFGLPGSIRDTIIGRVQDFSDPGRTVAEVAAVVGARASYALIESTTGLEPAEVLSALEELCTHGVLDERSEGGEVVYDFRHPLVRQTLYDELGLQRARILHGVVAEAMEEYYGAKAEDHADELAFHFARTDGGRSRAKATRYLATAGRRALERRADLEAINYLEAALARAGESEPDNDSIHIELIPLLARAHTHVGHFDTAAQLWASALEHVSEDQPEYPALCRALGMTNVWRGRHEEAAKHFHAGLVAAEAAGEDAATVRLLVAQAHGLHELGRGADALDTLAKALPLADTLDDAGLLARVHRALALLHVWVGPPEKAIEHGERAIEMARRVGDLSVEFWARWGLAVLEGMRGDTKRMARGIDDLNEIADRARSPVLRLWTADMSVELAYGKGDWDAGIAKGEQAISLARSLSQRTLLPRLLVWTSQFYVARGELEHAEALVNEAVEMSGLDDEHGSVDVHQVVPTYIGLAHHLVALGEYEDAIDAAEKGLRIAEGTGYVLWAIHRLLPILAEACLWAGHIDRAEEVGRRMRAHADRIDHKIGRAWADACDSLVQWKRGDAAGAVDLMKSAADQLDAIPMIWYATRLRRQLAGRLCDIGRRDEALRELDRVHERCVQVRAALELEKTRAMYREMGMRPPPLPVADGPLGLTPAELTIAKSVAGGMSNKAVAVELGCSSRTVSTHLSNIYTKLDIGGPGARVRLGNLVREAGHLN
jgi:tetratricopeptide (TPR) repeat protein